MRKFLYFILSSLMAGAVFSVSVFEKEEINALNLVSTISERELDGVSEWAKKEVGEAVKLGLVPENLQMDFNRNITREEFCKLCIAVMKAWDKDFKYETGNASFSDTASLDVLICAENGIVSGVGDNKFAPYNPIRRQESAKMLYNTLNIKTNVISEIYMKAPDNSVSECCVPHSFNDGGDIRSWARKEINHMYRYGVMLGDSDNNYDPDGYYTREQATVTFLRLFKCKDFIEENPIPEKDYYPYGDIAWAYDYDGRSTYLNYEIYKNERNIIGSERYIDGYIDSSGKRYSNNEKGYIYPPDRKYAAFTVQIGPGVGRCVIVDQKGDIRLKNINGGRFYFMTYVVADKYANVRILPDMGDYNKEGVYDIESEERVFDDIDYMGDGYYRCINYNSEGVCDSMGVVDKNGKVIFENKYIPINTKCYNNTFILKNKDGSYSIAKTDGKIYKRFKADKNWEFKYSIGSNIVFVRKIDEIKNEYILYRSYSEKLVNGFSYLEPQSNGEFIGKKENPKEEYSYNYYILNSDGSVKFDAEKYGYNEIGGVAFIEEESSSNYYFYKDLGVYRVVIGEEVDIIGKNGNIIKKGVDKNSLIVDKSGILAYEKDNKILFFDFFGDDIGSFDFNGEVWYNSDTEKEENIIKIRKKEFFNGLLWVVGITDMGSICEKYVLPDGRSFTNWK